MSKRETEGKRESCSYIFYELLGSLWYRNRFPRTWLYSVLGFVPISAFQLTIPTGSDSDTDHQSPKSRITSRPQTDYLLLFDLPIGTPAVQKIRYQLVQCPCPMMSTKVDQRYPTGDRRRGDLRDELGIWI